MRFRNERQRRAVMAALGAGAGAAVGYGGAKVLRGGLRKMMGRSWKRSHAMKAAASPQLELFEPSKLKAARVAVKPSQARTLERITRHEATDFRNMMRAVKPGMFAGVGAVGGAVTGMRGARNPPSTRIAVVTASPSPATLRNSSRDEGTITTGVINAKQRGNV